MNIRVNIEDPVVSFFEIYFHCISQDIEQKYLNTICNVTFFSSSEKFPKLGSNTTSDWLKQMVRKLGIKLRMIGEY